MAFPTIWTDERRETLKRLMKSTIIAYLDTVLPPSIRAVGVSNNPRSRITGAKEKARGMRKGSPDIILSGTNHYHVLLERELARPERTKR